MRVLIRGTSGANISNVAKGAGVARQDVALFLKGEGRRDVSVDKMARFIWNRMNRHVLIAESDRA